MDKKYIEKLERKIEQLEKKLQIFTAFYNAPNKDCLTVKEVAIWLGCSPDTVKRYEKEGMLIARFPNAKKRFAGEDVNRFMRGFMVSKRTRHV